MLKIIGSSYCKDTVAALETLKNNNTEYEFYDVSTDMNNLRKYLELRENEEVFIKVRAEKRIGFPCFILDNGKITFDIEEI